MIGIIETIFDFWERDLPKHYNTDIIRASQVQMSFDIADFLHPENKKKYMIIEAPVGTGKSLGSLLPTLLRRKSLKQVIYATSTINLQGQLIREEVPILRKLNHVNREILAKGKTHYFCYSHYSRNKSHFNEDFENIVQKFYNSTKTGQRDEFEKEYKPIPDDVWDKISLVSSKHECSGCKYNMTCNTYHHRSKFLSPDNDLVITNHNQLIQSFLNYQNAKNYILPVHPGTIIIDEAHDFVENYLSQVKNSIDMDTLKALQKKIITKHLSDYKKDIQRILNIINKKKSELESVQGRYKIEENIMSLLAKIRSYMNESLISNISMKNNLKTNKIDVGQEELSDALDILDSILSTESVTWICYEEKRLYSISKQFRENFSKLLKLMSADNKIIFMSGTLATNNNFEYIINLWQLSKDVVETKIYDSPFCYEKQAIMYVPHGLINKPKENSDTYIENQLKKINELLKLTNGRSLILATSKIHMNNIYAGLLDYSSDKHISLYLQGTSSVESLSEAFKHDEDSILVGTKSFYSGLSVKGTSLVSVIITKLPFAVPDDPFFELMGQEYDEEEKINNMFIPNMLITLKQAVGRLIRDISDYGIVTILDRRIFDRDYGDIIRETFMSLGYKITRDFVDVEKFYNNISNIEDSDYPSYSRELITISVNLKKENNPPRKSFSEKTDIQEPKIIISNVRRKREKKKQQYYWYYGKRIPISEVNLNTDTLITEDQYNFARNTLKKIGKRPTKINKIADSHELYKYIYDVFQENLCDIKFIRDNFPYIDKSQKTIFIKYRGKHNIIRRGGTVKKYLLTKEELARL